MSETRRQLRRWVKYVRTCRKAGHGDEEAYGLHRVRFYRNMSRIVRRIEADK